MAGRRLNQLLAVLMGRAPRCETSGTYTGTGNTVYDLSVTTAGISGAAVLTWKQVTAGATIATGTATLTSGTAATIGALGLSITVYWTGLLQVGTAWHVEAYDTPNIFSAAMPLDNIGLEPAVPLAASADGGLCVSGLAASVVSSTIAGSGTTSPDWIDVRGYCPIFGSDAAFAGTDMTFLHSFDGVNSAGALLDGDGNAVTLVTAASKTVCPIGGDAVALAAAYWIKIVKTTAQGAGTPTTVTVGRAS